MTEPRRKVSQLPTDEVGTVTAENGAVLLDGPGPVAVAWTPEAADATGRRLREAARRARAQHALANAVVLG